MLQNNQPPKNIPKVNLCPHGQEFYCRICGTIEHIIVYEQEELKRDYNNVRGSMWYYQKEKYD